MVQLNIFFTIEMSLYYQHNGSNLPCRSLWWQSDTRAGRGSEQGKYVKNMGTKGMASPEGINKSQSLLLYFDG